MTESFPRQQARTRRFTLGVPRAFAISPAGDRITFLRSKNGSDPLTCLWLLDVGTGTEWLIADPAALSAAGDEDLPPEEKRRRERAREQAGGIVSYAVDAALRTAVFGLAGRVFAVDLAAGETDAAHGAGGPAVAAGTGDGAAAPRELVLQAPALDPRPDPAGQRVAYVSGGALRVASLDGAGTGDKACTGDRAVAGPADAPGITFGLAEFIAAEEMFRARGYWWAPDGTGLLVARVDETPVMRWHIADPANPERSPAEVAYPAAGTPNADVSLILADLEGRHTPVEWDRAAFPYLVTVCWDDKGGALDPLIAVQSRDQRRMQILVADRATGGTSLLREDTDPHWVDIVQGVPAWTARGRIVWTVTANDSRRLVVATPDELSGGRAEPVTPPGLQVREVLGVDGSSVLFTASTEPTEIGLWSYGPDGLTQVSEGAGVFAGRRAGGTTVLAGRSLDEDGVTVQVFRDHEGAERPAGSEGLEGPEGPVGHPGRKGPAGRGLTRRIACYDEPPNLPAPQPAMLSLGPRQVRAALLFPSGHEPGSGPLPVLLDPYGGPHAQQILAARGAYPTSQWFAEQGFAVLVTDGRGTPGRGPRGTGPWPGTSPTRCWRIRSTRCTPPRNSSVTWTSLGSRSGAGRSAGTCPHWPCCAARTCSTRRSRGRGDRMAPVRHPLHRAVPGPAQGELGGLRQLLRGPGRRKAPSRRPGRGPGQGPGRDRGKATFGPMMLIHGLADDNVVVAHTLRLSSALLAAGYAHTVLPLSGVTHMTPQEVVAENLLLLQLDFLRQSLGEGQPADM